MTTSLPFQPDVTAEVVVVGARCAGAATAMLLARQGHDVVLVDRYLTPHDTVSTHSIARSGVVQLARWGLLDAVLDEGTPPITHITFHSGGSAERRRVADRAGVDHLIAPRRHVLDEVLLEAAIEAGVRVHTGVRISGIHRTGAGRVDGVYGTKRSGELVRFGGRFVVGADGLTSVVARSVGARIVDSRRSPGGTAYAYYGGIEWDGIEFYLGSGVFAGIFPTNGGEAAVWMCTLADRIDAARHVWDSTTGAFDGLLSAALPELAERLAGATRTAPIHVSRRLPNHMLAPVGSGWALVGDAAYHRDPVTGHGISDAFRDAELLAGAIGRSLRGGNEAAELAEYWRRRDEMASPIFELTCAMAQQPPAQTFIAHQRALSKAIEAEATELASWPSMTDRALVAA
jgi:2-polyprenyl-6-methoxyphenol hydroxylase-like FAD-dependent oxidoreductase